MDFPDLKIDSITVVIQGEKKRFYEKELGVIWNEEKCADCTLSALKGKLISEKCKKRLDKKCYEKFRHSPEFIFRDIHEEKEKKKKNIDQTSMWECEECFLMNKDSAKKCASCKTLRPN